MSARLLHALSVPFYDDDDKARLAGFLNTILATSVLITLINLLSRVLLAPLSSEGVWLNFIVLIFQGGVWAVLRRGHLRFTRIALICGSWALLTFAIVIGGRGLNDPSFVFYTVFMVMVGLTLGRRGAALFAALTGLVSLSLSPPILLWVNYTLTFAVSAVLLSLAHDSIRQALQRARRSEQVLAEQNAALRASEAHLQTRTQSLATINAIAAALHSSLDFQTVVERALDSIKDYTHAQVSALFLVDDKITEVAPIAARADRPEVLGLRLLMPDSTALQDASLTALALKQKQIVISANVIEDDRLDADIKQMLTEAGFASAAAIPLMVQERALGAISIAFKDAYALSSEEQATLLSIGSTMALAIANAQYVTRIEAEVRERRLMEAAREQAQQALSESETRYRIVSELISDYAFCFGVEPDGKLIPEWSTPASFQRLTGYTFEEIGPSPKLYHPDEAETVVRHIQEVKQGKITSADYRIFTKDGTLRWLHIVRHPVWDEAQQRVIRFYGIAQDITDRKRAEAGEIEMAVAVERERVEMLRQFLSHASHDLGTPLATMNTSLYLLRKVTDTEKQVQYIDQIATQTRRVQDIISDMVSLSRLDAMSEKFTFVRCPLNRLLEAISTEQQPLAAQKQHQIMVNLDPQNLTVCADSAALRTALNHILVNALNYTPPGGIIRVNTCQREDEAVIEIVDNGIGISAEDLPRIFERFYRADKARQTDTGASGLGLTIAQKIIQMHSGQIEVESILGQGSTFRVRLPLVNAPQQSSQPCSSTNTATG